MPNFNGAIIMHTLQSLKSPATLREIVMTIAKHTELSTEDLKKPVKQTLEMGELAGFLQKLNGRYFLAPMTFSSLMSDIKNLDYDNIEIPSIVEKRMMAKKQGYGTQSTTTLMPQVVRTGPKRLQSTSNINAIKRQI
ncbi:uncharacterized protein Dwil_GK21045 [Drosophila willistoni]|uniref:DUF4777 domain-containing protein n=2 Tax=Drosophila willistoni TaxID=7260 RepID=B4N7D4_DROWI|nr:uncharacterized protein Dwil_GK21045 [Drosophila willistoni]